MGQRIRRRLRVECSGQILRKPFQADFHFARLPIKPRSPACTCGAPRFDRETSEMKISLEWLAEYLPGALDAQAAADALTHGGLPVEQIEKVGPDTVIDVEVTSNRSDCLSHLGVARELAALLNRSFVDA